MISVIVPVYNTADYLSRCIHSILRSSYEDFELILVDDGSSDRSASICRKFCKQDCRVKYFRQEHRGVSAARNKGMDESRGTWLLFVDSDDVISPDFLEMVACGGFGKEELLLFDFVRMRRGRMVRGRKAAVERAACRRYGKKDGLHLVRCLLDMRQLRENANVNLASPCAKAYKRAVIERHHICFKETLAIYEDRLFNIEYFMAANSYTYVQRTVYFAEVRADSAMRGFCAEFLWNDIRYQEELLSMLKGYHIFPKVAAAYYNSVLSHMTDVLVRGIFHPSSGRTYEESCRQCNEMQGVEIYRRAAKYRKQTGNLPRRVLLFFYYRKEYCIVKMICRMSYRILELTGWL